MPSPDAAVIVRRALDLVMIAALLVVAVTAVVRLVLDAGARWLAGAMHVLAFLTSREAP